MVQNQRLSPATASVSSILSLHANFDYSVSRDLWLPMGCALSEGEP